MDLALVIEPQSTTPLHIQLYQQLRLAIVQGRVTGRLPSSRALAKSLGLSRTTVTQGYDQLMSEGYLQTRTGAGTFVCDQLPEKFLQAESHTATDQENKLIRLSPYGERLLTSPTHTPEFSADISFRYGRPALDLFPVETWRKLLTQNAQANTDWLDYAPQSSGCERLKVAIATYLNRARAVQCQPEQILITNGTQQALDLIVRLLVCPESTIAIEEPGYRGARNTFAASGASILSIPVDRDGIIVDQLVAEHQPPSLVYVTPSHQFPTGALLSLTRRLALLEWAHQSSAMIIEDDYDSEYRYGGRPIPALQGLDTCGSVLYVGTFSKVMFPSLRIGYIVLPSSLTTVFNKAKRLTDRQPPTLTQLALADFIQSGYLERHIRKMRIVYERRRQATVAALHQHFEAEILGDSAGLHVMARLNLPLDDDEVVARAAEVGVALVSARIQYQAPYRQGEFVFGYAELNETLIEEAIQRMALVLKASA